MKSLMKIIKAIRAAQAGYSASQERRAAEPKKNFKDLFQAPEHAGGSAVDQNSSQSDFGYSTPISATFWDMNGVKGMSNPTNVVYTAARRAAGLKF